MISSVANTKTLSIPIGDAESKVINTVNTVTAKAHSAAVDIKILPTPTIGGVAPEHSARRDHHRRGLRQRDLRPSDRQAGWRSDVRPGDRPRQGSRPDAAARRCRRKGIAVALGQDIVLLAGTPLESRIVLGAGKIVDDGVFGKKAVADGVAVELLKGISGGIVLNLAHAEAGAISNLPVTKVLDIPSLDIARGTPTSLPRTGAETALPLALAGAGIALVAVRRCAWSLPPSTKS